MIVFVELKYPYDILPQIPQIPTSTDRVQVAKTQNLYERWKKVIGAHYYILCVRNTSLVSNNEQRKWAVDKNK